MTMTPPIARALTGHTPGNRWRAEGHPDPHGSRYDCPRYELPMADLSDDELANGVYLFGDSQPPIAELLSGKAKTSGVWLDAAKNRIRWLSRKLDDFADGYLELADENERLRSVIGRYAMQVGDAEGVYFADGDRLSTAEAEEVIEYATRAALKEPKP